MLAYAVHGGAYVVFGQMPTMAWACLFITISRGAVAVSSVMNFSLLLRHVEDRFRGRVFATVESLTWGTMMLSMMATGPCHHAVRSAHHRRRGGHRQFHNCYLLGDGRTRQAGCRNRRSSSGDSEPRSGWDAAIAALRLAAEGMRVAIHYGGSERDARSTAKSAAARRSFRPIWRASRKFAAFFDDVTTHFGRLDGLVNNAARFTRIDPLQIEETDWDYIHSVNLKSVFFCCQAAARIMLAGNGGSIVNISSLGAIRPWEGSRALLRFKGRRGHADPCAGESLGPEDCREFHRAGRHSVRQPGRPDHPADR